MDFPLQLAIAVSLAIDACIVGMAVGSRFDTMKFHPVFRLTFHFGLFQALMPLIGWFAGTSVRGYVGSYGHWIAFVLLAVVGIRMIIEAFSPADGIKETDLTRRWSLVMLSIATSIDALAVGVSFAFLEVNIWSAVLIIGLVASALTYIGMLMGCKVGSRLGNKMGIAGGLVLIGIGLKIVYENGGF